MKHTVFNPTTGTILYSLDVPDIANLLLNIPSGMEWIAGEYESETVYIHNGVPTTLPPKPGSWAVWDGNSWIDPRAEADIQQELWQQRETATPLSRAEFVLAAVRARIITKEEARVLIGNQIPESLLPLLSGLPESWLFDAEMRFKGAASFTRMDPLILILAAEIPVPSPAINIDEVMDMAFGLIPWSEDFPPV